MKKPSPHLSLADRIDALAGKTLALLRRLPGGTKVFTLGKNRRLTTRLPRLSVLVTAIVILLVAGAGWGTLGHLMYRNLDKQLMVSAQFVAQAQTNPGLLERIRRTVQNTPQPNAHPDLNNDGTPGPGTSPSEINTPDHGSGPNNKYRPEPATLLTRGALAESVHIIIGPDGIRAGRLDAKLNVKPLNDTQIKDIVKAAKNRPTSVYTSGLGVYRIIELTGKNTAGTPVRIIVGVPESDLWFTLAQFAGWTLLYSAIGLAAAWYVMRRYLRRELQPLAQVAATAEQIQSLDLTKTCGLQQRVDVSISGSDTEAGDVARAVNTALEHISTSLQQRDATEARLRQFVADASHELRTPIATISGYAQLLRRMQGEEGDGQAGPVSGMSGQVGPALEGAGQGGPADRTNPATGPSGQASEVSGDSTQQQAIARIHSEALRMGKLVNDLLTLARLDAGQAQVAQPVALAGLLVEAVSDAHVAAPDHAWDVELSDDAADIEVAGDAGRLQQVIANLLNNAYQHSPAGTRIVAALKRTQRDGHAWAELTVADNGPGIAADLRPHIFDRFARADSARTPGESFGLGLSIAASIVQAHGGHITCSEPPGGGATFTVTLPCL